MVGGAGAMIEATRAMASVQRQMDRFMRDRAQRRRARLNGRNLVQQMEPLRADFECFHLCGDCGFLVSNEKAACPGCDTRNWMDLTDHNIADAVRDIETMERTKTPGWIKGVTLLVSVSVAAALATLVILLAPGFAWHAILVAMVAVPLGYFFGHRGMAVLLLRLVKRRRPHRWRLPLPIPDGSGAARDEVSGVAAAADGVEPLRAPFSGKACLAYQVCVLFDTPGDARPPEWVLEEAVAVDFNVGDRVIPGERAFVEGPLEVITPDEAEASGLNLWKFLRQRGLFSFDGDFDLFEARVAPGDEVNARIFADNQAVLISGKSVAAI